MSQGRQVSQDARDHGKVQNPKKAGSLERGKPLSLLTIPWNPARKWNVGSTSGRKGRRGSDREAGPKAAEEKALKGRNTQEGKVRRSLPSGGGFRSPSRSELTSGVAPTPAKAEAEKRQERRGPERGTAGREEQGPEGQTPWALPWSTDQVPGPVERKPSRGYSTPEGGRCRGVEPPGKPDPSGWDVP